MFFYQFLRLPFWQHPFTAEDPVVSKWCSATFLQMCSDEEANSSMYILDVEMMKKTKTSKS